jgi:ATP/ADP translocase
MIARIFGNLLSIKPNEWDGVFYFFLVSLIISFGASFARSIGMTLFLDKVGGNYLPFIFIIQDLLVMVGSIVYAHYTRKATGIAILEFFLLSTFVFSVLAQILFILTQHWWEEQFWVYGFFLVGFLFFYILISIHVGSVVASYFTAVQVKRITPVVNAGLPIGGALGGSTLIILLNLFHLEPHRLIIVLGVACLIAYSLLRIINARLTPVRASTAQLRGNKNPVRELLAAFNYVLGSQLMIFMSLGLMLFVIGNKLLEYQYQTIIYSKVFTDPTERATFFATYEVFANLAWLLIQLFITSRIIIKIGVGASNVIYPVLAAFAALALFIYFYLQAQNIIQQSYLIMLTLGIITQFINQEMRGALRTPANNLLFNAIPPSLWGTNKAFLNGIVFPLATVIASTFVLLMTGMGADSTIAELKPALAEEKIHYILPLIALIVSVLGVLIALPQWSAYDKGMFGLLNRDLFDRRMDVNHVSGRNNLKQVIEQKLNSNDQYHVIAALEMIRVLRLNPFVNQVGNLLLKNKNFEIKKYCISTLAALPQSQTNLIYLMEALQTERDAQVLPLILKNLAHFKTTNFNQPVEKLLKHPSTQVFVEACLYLYQNPQYENKKRLEKELLERLRGTQSADTPLYLYAIGELRQPRNSELVLPYLDSKQTNTRLSAFTAFIRMLEGQLEPHKERLIRALSSSDKEIKIVALRALKECQPLDDWTPVIQLLGAKERTLVNESKELLRLNLKDCKPALVEQIYSNKITAQQRFEILSLIYPKLTEEQRQHLRQHADNALKTFIQINGLLKLHETLYKTSKAHDLISKILQEIAEEHLLHVLTVITFASEQNMEFYQRVSRGLLSLSRANQGNALEVLSNAREKYLVNRVLKYFDERLNDLKAIARIHVALFGEALKIDKANYTRQLVALNHEMIIACLFYLEKERTGILKLKQANHKVRSLLTIE